MKPTDDIARSVQLERVEQLLRDESTRRDGLSRIVTGIGNAFEADVCSLYLLDPDGQYLTLAATVGLRQDSIGKVCMTLDEGLVGLVAAERAPLSVAYAQEHPRFKYFPEAGEDPYQSFFGVPIMLGDQLCGVLVVQTIEPRALSLEETRQLTEIGKQLAPLLAGIHATPAGRSPSDSPTPARDQSAAEE